MVFGAAAEGADASPLAAAFAASGLPNRPELCATAGGLIVPLEAAADPEGPAKLNDGVDGCFDVLAKREDALAELVGCPVEPGASPTFEKKPDVDLFSTGLPAAASGGCPVLSNKFP